MNPADVSRLAQVIDAIGSERLGQAVDAAVQATLGFDMSCAYLFRLNQPPVLVHDGYRQRVAERTLKAYLRGGYLLDPFYVACTHQHPAGLWRMSDLAPDSFHASWFSISRDIHPCVSSHHGSLIEEIGFIVPVQPKTALVYSLMRGLDQGAFSGAELQALAALAPVIESAFGLHLSLRHADDLSDPIRADPGDGRCLRGNPPGAVDRNPTTRGQADPARARQSVDFDHPGHLRGHGQGPPPQHLPTPGHRQPHRAVSVVHQLPDQAFLNAVTASRSA